MKQAVAFGQVVQNHGGEAPDVVMPIGQRGRGEREAVVGEGAALIIGSVEGEIERQVKDFGHFVGIGAGEGAFGTQRGHGCNGVARGGEISGQLRKSLPMRGFNAGFFGGFAQGGGGEVWVLRIAPAAGQRNLAGVVAQAVGAAGEQNLPLRFMLHHCQQYGGLAELAALKHAVAHLLQGRGKIGGAAEKAAQFGVGHGRQSNFKFQKLLSAQQGGGCIVGVLHQNIVE